MTFVLDAERLTRSIGGTSKQTKHQGQDHFSTIQKPDWKLTNPKSTYRLPLMFTNSSILYRSGLTKAYPRRLPARHLKPRPPTSRQFHASRPNQIIEQALHLSHDVFEAVHTYSGLPWGLSIPLTAIFFRLSFLPVQYLSERSRKRQQSYIPVLSGWRSLLQRKVQQNNLDSKAIPNFGAHTPQAYVEAKLKEKLSFLVASHKVSRWHQFLPLTFVPLWILNIDVLRRMCGLQGTLLSLIDGSGDKLDPTIVPPEPSLALEGILTFQDLLLPDPTYLLPLTFWGFLLLKLYRAPRVKPGDQATSLMPDSVTKIAAVLRRLLVFYTLSIGPIIIYNQFPSAIVLYWLSGNLFTDLERWALRRFMGVEKPSTPKVVKSAKVKEKVPQS